MIKFVINLERCLERMDYFDDSYKRWVATDYKDLDDDILGELSENLHSRI